VAFESWELEDFWDDSEDDTKPEPITPELIALAERRLGYKLPRDYLTLLVSRNGGTPRKTCFPTSVPTSWASDHIAITDFGRLGGRSGVDSENRNMIEEWGYPDIGVIICSCPSAGHDAVMLDYSVCGPQGEPRVVHVEVERSAAPEITPPTSRRSCVAWSTKNTTTPPPSSRLTPPCFLPSPPARPRGASRSKRCR
jgi:hypothetical protein